MRHIKCTVMMTVGDHITPEWLKSYVTDLLVSNDSYYFQPANVIVTNIREQAKIVLAKQQEPESK